MPNFLPRIAATLGTCLAMAPAFAATFTVTDGSPGATGPGSLRWAVQQGAVVIPASQHRQRWLSNADLFSFELTDQEMIDLATIDLGEAKAWDANTHEEW